MSILISILTSQWFYTAILTPVVLWLLSKFGKKIETEKVEKAIQILYEIVKYACMYAETESKKGNMILSKRDFVLEYVKQHIPDSVKNTIPDYTQVAKAMIEKYLASDESPDAMTQKVLK